MSAIADRVAANPAPVIDPPPPTPVPPLVEPGLPGTAPAPPVPESPSPEPLPAPFPA